MLAKETCPRHRRCSEVHRLSLGARIGSLAGRLSVVIGKGRPVGVALFQEGVAACPGDCNGDGHVDTEDMLQLLGNWGPCTECQEDLDDDGQVGVSDLLSVLSYWGDCD